MKRHSQTSNATRPGTPRRCDADVPLGFLDAWQRALGTWVPTLPTRRGRPPRVPLTEVLPALTYHVLRGPGTLAAHFAELFGEPFADSSWSDRRTRLPWEIFADLMRHALRPQATRRHRDSFWRGWRLVALDGTQFSLTNTPQMARSLRKAITRRGRAAFAKLTTVVLLEVGWHNPLAAAIGRHGQSEWRLSQGLLAQLPGRALLLADRLYGCAAFAAEACVACQRVGSHFLMRARTNIKPQILHRFADGSRLIRVTVYEKRGRQSRPASTLEVREIRARVGRPGYRTVEVRLWTSLLEPKTAPALELVQLYTRRWEHEVYYRELKRQLRRTEVLQSHTLETAAQEVAALLLVSALLARERARAAVGETPVLRVSFSTVLDIVRTMWLFFGVFEDLISDRQKRQIVARGYDLIGGSVTAKRPPRTCLRAVRQPVRRWPRLLKTKSVEGPFHVQVL